MTTIEYKASREADIFYTRFTWSLHHWTLFYYRDRGTSRSPEFDVAGAEGCKCSLKLEQSYINANKRMWKMNVEFSGKHSFHVQQATISIVDNEKKSCTPVQNSPILGQATPIWLEWDSFLELPKLPGDTLTVLFELRSLTNVRYTTIKRSTCNPYFRDCMLDNLANLFETKEFNDITFVVKGTTLGANKLVLALHSKVFKAMFNSNMKEQIEGVVHIDDVDAKIFKILLKYMYTGKVENMGEVVTELVLVADKYEMLDLVNICIKFMTVHMRLENAVQYLNVGNLLGCARLEKRAIDFIKDNKQVLGNLENIHLLYKHPKSIVQIFSE